MFKCVIRHTEPVQCFCTLLIQFRQQFVKCAGTAVPYCYVSWVVHPAFFLLFLWAIAALKAATSEKGITQEQVCHFKLLFH